MNRSKLSDESARERSLAGHDSNSLFSGRASILISGGGAFIRATWPLGKVSLEREALVLDTLIRSFRLPLAEIVCIRRCLLSVSIEHRARDVPEYVSIAGFRLFHRLRAAIEQYSLPVDVTNTRR